MSVGKVAPMKKQKGRIETEIRSAENTR
jgi:hypothetical protein